MADERIVGIAQMHEESKVMLGAIVAGLLNHAKDVGESDHEAIESLETLLLKCGEEGKDIELTAGEARILDAILVMNKMMGESNEGKTIH